MTDIAALDRHEPLLAGLAVASRPGGATVDDALLAEFMEGRLDEDSPGYRQVVSALVADPALRNRWLAAAELEEALGAPLALAGLGASCATPVARIDDETLARFIEGRIPVGDAEHDAVLTALATDPVLRERWRQASALAEELPDARAEASGAVVVPLASARRKAPGAHRRPWIQGLFALAASVLAATWFMPRVPGPLVTPEEYAAELRLGAEQVGSYREGRSLDLSTPVVRIVSPGRGAEVRSPFDLQLEFAAAEGEAIDPSSFRARFGNHLAADITGRLLERGEAGPAGFQARELELAPGRYVLRFEIADRAGRTGEAAIQFTVVDPGSPVP